MDTYHAKLTFITEMLGTAPMDKDTYSKHIVKKHDQAIERAEKKGDTAAVTELQGLRDTLAYEEVDMLPTETVDKGKTVFRRGKDGALVIMDFMIRGFLKEAGEAVTGGWGMRSYIDKWVFCKQREIPLLFDGAPITEPDDVFERPLRCETMKGPRVALAASEIIAGGGVVEFDIVVLPLATKGGKKGDKLKIDEATLRSWFAYGELCGIGQWRSGSYGRFTTELTRVQ